MSDSESIQVLLLLIIGVSSGSLVFNRIWNQPTKYRKEWRWVDGSDRLPVQSPFMVKRKVKMAQPDTTVRDIKIAFAVLVILLSVLAAVMDALFG